MMSWVCDLRLTWICDFWIVWFHMISIQTTHKSKEIKHVYSIHRKSYTNKSKSHKTIKIKQNHWISCRNLNLLFAIQQRCEFPTSWLPNHTVTSTNHFRTMSRTMWVLSAKLARTMTNHFRAMFRTMCFSSETGPDHDEPLPDHVPDHVVFNGNHES